MSLFSVADILSFKIWLSISLCASVLIILMGYMFKDIKEDEKEVYDLLCAVAIILLLIILVKLF